MIVCYWFITVAETSTELGYVYCWHAYYLTDFEYMYFCYSNDLIYATDVHTFLLISGSAADICFFWHMYAKSYTYYFTDIKTFMTFFTTDIRKI